jgi:hypothetical protein
MVLERGELGFGTHDQGLDLGELQRAFLRAPGREVVGAEPYNGHLARRLRYRHGGLPPAAQSPQSSRRGMIF